MAYWESEFWLGGFNGIALSRALRVAAVLAETEQCIYCRARYRDMDFHVTWKCPKITEANMQNGKSWKIEWRLLSYNRVYIGVYWDNGN